MRPVKGSIEIGRPVEEVFDFVADERNEPRYNRRVRRVDLVPDGAVGRGSHFRAELARVGRTVPLDIVVTGYERPRLLASSSRTRAMDIWGSLAFQSVPGGTRLSWHWELRPHGPWSMLGSLLVPAGRVQERRTWRALKRLLEADGTVVAGPGREAAGREAANGPSGTTGGRGRRRLGLSVAAGAVAAGAVAAGAALWLAFAEDPRRRLRGWIVRHQPASCRR